MKVTKSQLGFKKNEQLAPGDMIKRANELKQNGMRDMRKNINSDLKNINPKALKYRGIALAM